MTPLSVNEQRGVYDGDGNRVPETVGSTDLLPAFPTFRGLNVDDSASVEALSFNQAQSFGTCRHEIVQHQSITAYTIQ